MGQKIVFFDIDGTIYEYGKPIAGSTITAIQKLKENGHIPVICTGRTKAMVFDCIFQMGFDSIISGGGTYAEYHKKQLYLYELEGEVAERTIKTMINYKFMPIPEGHRAMYIDENRITESYLPFYQIYQKEIPDRIKPIDYKDIQISKISGVIGKDSDINGIQNELGNQFHFVNHAGSLLELIPKPFSKALGIERMIKYLGISKEDTYAFGDSFNDLEMLTYVKYGVAMGNSHPDLFQHVRYRTESIMEDGIYKGLERLKLI